MTERWGDDRDGRSDMSENRYFLHFFIIHPSKQALLHVNAGIPIRDALAQASDFCSISMRFRKIQSAPQAPNAMVGAHYLTALSNAVIDVVKVLT
jgi:hypothetical protein